MKDAGTFIFLLEIVLARMKATQRCESSISHILFYSSAARRARIKRNPANKEGISSLVISNFSYKQFLCFHAECIISPPPPSLSRINVAQIFRVAYKVM